MHKSEHERTIFQSPTHSGPLLAHLLLIGLEDGFEQRLRVWVCRCESTLEHVKIHRFVLDQCRSVCKAKINQDL